MPVRIGTAGWTIPSDVADRFPTEGTSLERYAACFPAAEINSSFHRPHRISTWERWRDSVPDDFRFSAKLPKTITHQRKLVDCGELIGEFLPQAEALGDKLAVLLVQLPPKLAFDQAVAEPFFLELGQRTAARIACEPRNTSWFDPAAGELLERLHVARVAADPAVCAAAAQPGGSPGLRYWRLHGSPVIYRSSYSERITSYAKRIAAADDGASWCMFDNTASSAATADALMLLGALDQTAGR
jgi:uncharacterized protein YecE (DUF72 family)